MMGKATTCLYWNIGRGRYIAVSTAPQRERCGDAGRNLLEDETEGGVGVGAEAVARHGGTLKLIPKSRKKVVMEKER